MKIVALVLAGGEGTRLYPLTAEHAKPALPFANGYRICDFVLSNLVNSNISTIYVLAQYKPESLMKHVQKAWAPWFHQSEGAIKVLLPRSNTLAGQFKGTADAVYQHLDVLGAHAPDLVAVFVNMMGIYPLGTLVRLDTGELAIVFHVDPAAPRRPLVKVVRSGDGAVLSEARIVDLGERDESGAYQRSITGTVDSVSQGINIPSYLWESRTT